MLDATEVLSSKAYNADLESLRGRLTSATCNFSQHLATQRRACLAQIWVPGSHQGGPVTLHTQGVPFSVAGCADLLALFRCVSCRYKFGTDTSKPVLMGAVGRVFTTGEPEMSHNVQQYDKQQFLRVEEAHRCRVHSALFMPLYTSANRRQPFAVFEVVQTDTDVMFPVLVHWLKCCLQEVQLYTADADQQAMTMGLRTHALGPTQTSPTLKRPSSSKVSIKEESDSQGQSRQPCLASHTHCSASSLEDVTAAPDAATVTRLACKMHEVTADSEEVKRGSGEPGGGSPQSSNPVSVASLGPCRMSSTQRYQSGELQTVSAGSFEAPGSAAAVCCPPAHLVAVGKTLQLQTCTAPTELQTPPFPVDKCTPASSAPARAPAPSASPFVLHQVQQHQHQVQQQQYQQQHQLQFLANALQLQSQLSAQTQIRPNTSGAGGSAFAGYKPFSPSGALPQGSGLPACLADEEEGGSAGGEEDTQINNRVAGGAGKRLSVEDLQSQFGYGLREAAHNLKICPTTLKRACRRHGIYRWPRRQGWAGASGDAGCTESMNLDGDSVSSAGLNTASEQQAPAGPAPATGDAGMLGLLSTSLSTTSSGPVPGHSLEGFKALDSSAQLALLQRLAAAKAEPKWLQGGTVNAAMQLPAVPRTNGSMFTPSVSLHNAPGRQLGSGLVASMLAHGPDCASQMPAQASQIGMLQHSLVKTASLLPQPSMARQHSMPVLPCQPQQAQQQHSGFERPSSAGVLPGRVGQGMSVFPQGIAQQPSLAVARSQGLSQRPNLGTALQGSAQQPSLVSQPPSGLLHQTGLLPTNLSSSSSSCFTSIFPSQPAVPSAWQQQKQTIASSYLASVEHQHPQTSSLHIGSAWSDVPCRTLDSECVVLNGERDLESGSSQGGAAMQFDSSDYALESLDLLTEGDLSLDHHDALDFDPADCLF